ncbi:AraC family transcriptional regulator [Undibacterium sp. KW1]|uniref:helix-turn-helix transcriptional regulator n=1 Tax=Undibacterium sp. KW1 TaxID=2058624 RepID=UPI001389AAD6|nr:AraC family transcriptional regulator [Undibacterium sp. KW1]
MPASRPKQFTLLPCHLPGVEAVRAQSRHRFGRHMHEQFGIGVLVRGAQKSLSRLGMVEAMAGDTITVNPGEIHDGTPIGDSGRSWQMLYFEPALIASLMTDISEGKMAQAEFRLPVMRDARIRKAMQELFATMTATPHVAMLAEEQMLLLFASVMQQPAVLGQATPTAIHHARSRIDDDPTSILSLQDLAQQSGLSRFQLLRAFAKATGMTPHAYILQRRLHHARRLIAAGMPLVQVAMDSGFADQSHLTRLFVRNFGISPGAYSTKR